MSEFKVMTLKVGETEMLFSDANEMTRWRLKTAHTKEPATIKWLESFEPESLFFDVGANMGLYTIWAAMRRNCQVHAFEPEAENFALVNRNIRFNKLSKQVTAWPIAAYNRHAISTLYVSGMDQSGSAHSFNESVSPKLEDMDFGIEQGSVSWALDELVDRGTLPSPRYVKIDVDGLEHRVIEGMNNIIHSDTLHSLLIELTPENEPHQNIINLMQEAGFSYDAAQVKASTRSEGYWAGTAEYIFFKDANR